MSDYLDLTLAEREAIIDKAAEIQLAIIRTLDAYPEPISNADVITALAMVVVTMTIRVDHQSGRGESAHLMFQGTYNAMRQMAPSKGGGN